MMELNFFFIFWLLLVVALNLMFLLTKVSVPPLTKVINELQLYGKAKRSHDQETKESPLPEPINFLVNGLQIPKRYFVHLYLFGVVLQTANLLLFFIGDHQQFDQLANLNRLIFGSKSIQFLGSISKWQTVLAFLFLHLQLIRRFYENLRISLFSNTGIHLAHYLVGFVFYASIVLLQFNLLFRKELQTAPIAYPFLAIGSSIYVLGSVMQHISLRQLASLRSTKKAATLDRHYLPHGFMFEYVSCPHYFGEILIYLGISVLLHWYISVFVIFLWTFCIHIPMALQSHCWYRTHFSSSYPKDRKALIPFLL